MLATKIASIEADLTTNWASLDAAGKTAALRAACILSIKLAKFVAKRFL